MIVSEAQRGYLKCRIRGTNNQLDKYILQICSSLSSTCLTSNFYFSKIKSSANRRERQFMDTRPQFRILNSHGKNIDLISSRRKQIFEVPHAVQEYTELRIPEKRYQTVTVCTFEVSSASALRYLGLDHFGKYRTKICKNTIEAME